MITSPFPGLAPRSGGIARSGPTTQIYPATLSETASSTISRRLVFLSSRRPRGKPPPREDDKTTRRQDDRSRASPCFAGGGGRDRPTSGSRRGRGMASRRAFPGRAASPRKRFIRICNTPCGSSRPSTIWRNSSTGSRANRGPSGPPESPKQSRRFRWTRRNSAGGFIGSIAS